MPRTPTESSDERAEINPQHILAPQGRPEAGDLGYAGQIGAATRAYIIPTWIAPRLPPPLSTNAGDPGALADAVAQPAPGAVATPEGPAVTQSSR